VRGAFATDYVLARTWLRAALDDEVDRFIARADEKLTAFLELESAIRALRQMIGSLFAHGSQACAEVAAFSAFSLLASLLT
jgi:hypothetical protein